MNFKSFAPTKKLKKDADKAIQLRKHNAELSFKEMLAKFNGNIYVHFMCHDNTYSEIVLSFKNGKKVKHITGDCYDFSLDSLSGRGIQIQTTYTYRDANGEFAAEEIKAINYGFYFVEDNTFGRCDEDNESCQLFQGKQLPQWKYNLVYDWYREQKQ